jgi:meiotically up-regulated gene 157 (Mug157) protein
MQNDNGQLANPPYLFQRLTTVATDTLMMSGRGTPNKINGLTRSLFRPSDDAVTFPLNIPGKKIS